MWVILVKTWVKTDHPYFPRRNRDLGMTISVKLYYPLRKAVYVGYCDVRCLSTLYVHA